MEFKCSREAPYCQYGHKIPAIADKDCDEACNFLVTYADPYVRCRYCDSNFAEQSGFGW